MKALPCNIGVFNYADCLLMLTASAIDVHVIAAWAVHIVQCILHSYLAFIVVNAKC